MVSDEEFQALQRRVDQLERVVTGVDADVAAIQAQRRADLELLMALRGTQLEQGERLQEHGERLDRIEVELHALGGRVTAGFETIIGMLQRSEPGDPV